MEAHYFIYPLNLHDLLREGLNAFHSPSQKEDDTIFVVPISKEELFDSIHNY